MTKQYEIDHAYFQGRREGFDPEVAEDLGIPMDPDTVEKQIKSAEQVAKLLGGVGLTQQAEIVDPTAQARQEAHEYYTQEFRLTGPRTPSTPQEKVVFNTGMTEVRAQSHLPRV